MHSEQKPIYICRNSKEAFKLSQHLHPDEKVMALHDFIISLFKKHPDILMPYRILNGIEEKLLWESCIKQHKKSFDLSQIKNLSETASEANRLIDQFMISDNTLKSEESTEEHTFFSAWRLIFKAYCKDKGVITFAELINITTTHIKNRSISINHPLHFVGFDLTTPNEDLFIEACKNQTHITLFKTPDTNPEIEPRLFLDEEHECIQVVEWCKTQIAQQKKILIATPHLDRIIEKLTRLLDKAFHPEAFKPKLSQEKRIYQFSLNTPLFYLPVIYLNLKLIELAAKGISTVKDLKNILSHNIWSNNTEFYQRQRLIHVLEKKRRGNILISELIEIAESIEDFNDSAPQFKNHLDQIQQSHLEWQKKRTVTEWVSAFDAFLQNLQSCLFNPKDISEENIYEAWKKVNEGMSSLNNLMGEISIHDMLDMLQYYLKKNTRQDHQGDFKIEILGFYESPLKTYDAVWIMNLNEHHWPPPFSYNPFIPIRIQRKSQINTQEIVRQRAEKVLEKFIHTAPIVVLSYAKKMGEEAIFPSPLLHTFTSSKPLEYTDFNYKKNVLNQFDIEYIEDLTSIPITAQKTIKSGIKLLEAQSICPAWAFYEFRLGAKPLEDEDEENLTIRLRGNILHKALEKFWMKYKSSSFVKSLSRENLSPCLKQVAHEVVSLEKKKYPKILTEFFDIEENRLFRYLDIWIQHELKRDDFEVKETEKNIPIQLSHLNFNIKIDRIDKVGQNEIVIDYKSGAQKSFNEWFLSGQGELQMPFYALFSSNHPVDAIAIGLINNLKPKWIGVGQDRDLLPGIKDPSSLNYQSWEELLGFWRCRIHDAVEDFEKGFAGVKFIEEKDLLYCHVKPILRIPERLVQFEEGQK